MKTHKKKEFEAYGRDVIVIGFKSVHYDSEFD